LEPKWKLIAVGKIKKFVTLCVKLNIKLINYILNI